jgi:tricarballylate dehydrogenase
MLNALYLTAERLGVTVRYDTEVTDVAIDDGFFTGVRAVQHGREEFIAGRAFVAAAGGFEANIDWLKEAWGEAAENFLIRGTPFNKGTVLRLLLDHGVQAIGDPQQCHAVAIDGRAAKFDGGIATRLDCVPFGIVVNKHAKRFYDEGEDFWPKRYAIWGRLVAAQPDQIGYVIVDAKAFDLFMPSVYPPLRADTIESMAQEFGIPPTELRTTIDAFNAACVVGRFDHTEHDQCHTEGLTPEKTHWARPIDTPPYYGYTLRPGITFTYLGVRVDRNAQMVMDTGVTAANMFAAGEIMAGNVLGKGYLAGIGMTIGSVFGRIAGEGAARAAKN